MTAANLPNAAPERWCALERELDLWPANRLVFWWRDDDVTSDTPALRQLLELRRRLDIPLAMSVIPAAVEKSLVAPLSVEPAIAILQHGWNHADHGRRGKYKAEFGEGRDRGEVLAQLIAGRSFLEQLFPGRLLPVLAPPFDYLSRHLVGVVREAGYRHVSVRGDFAVRSISSRNVHADLIEWDREIAADPAAVVRSLVAALRLRRFGIVRQSAPIGINTHHLQHDDEIWALNERVLTLLRSHRAVSFQPLEAVFR